RGMESLNIDAARLKELGMDGFAGPIKLTCADHNGHRPTFVQRFDGAKYVKVSDWIEPMHDKVGPLLKADAKAYAEKNAGWPKRTEPCDAK
ncbi:MAG TPA: ABC transporter permease, partial [Rhodoblastus sp.]|nr:ABC transporter permease [Rhodoblastus sp.]